MRKLNISVLKKNIPFFIFIVLLFILFSFTCNICMFNRIPGGIHFIRQTDSLAFASNYYHYQYSFFDPHVYSLFGDEGSAACEFPILYYITALIYRFTGEQFWVLRAINLLITTLGFISLFQFSKRNIADHFTSIIVALIPISSTVVLYYSTNFLVDSSALGLSLIGLNAYHKYICEKKKSNLNLAYAAFLFACLLKITFGILPLSLLLSTFLGVLVNDRSIPSIYRRMKHEVFLFACFLLFTSMWYVYAIYRNALSHDDYFLTRVIPLWKLDPSDLKHTIEAVTINWKSSYYYEETRYLFYLSLLVILLRWRKINPFLLRLFAIGVSGLVCYFILFFGQFKNHDYYFLPFVPFAAIALIAASSQIETVGHKLVKTLIKLTLAGILIGSIIYCAEKLSKRYSPGSDKFEYPGYELSDNTHSELHNTPINTRILILGDCARNGSLLFLQRKGYSFEDYDALLASTKKEIILNEVDYVYVYRLSGREFTDPRYKEISQTESWKVFAKANQ